MDFWTITTDSWNLMRRTGAVWRLALISAVQAFLYSVIVLGLIAPMVGLTQLAIVARSGADMSTPLDQPGSSVQFASAVSQAVQWVGANWALLVVGIVVITLAWVASGVLDVAATAGIITQTAASREGRPASAAAGLRDGFRIWWRTVGLLAVAALPSLVYMLSIAVFTFFTVSLPLYQGRLPEPYSLTAGSAMSAPLSTLVSFVAIPLGVLVMLGLRFAVLQDCEWREALRRAWNLARARFIDVLLMYLVVLGVTMAAIVLVGVVAGLIAIVFSIGIAIMLPVGGFSAPVIVLGAIFTIVCLLLLATTLVVALTWTSVAWTLFWRRTVGAEQPAASSSAAPFGTSVDPAISSGMRGDLT